MAQSGSMGDISPDIVVIAGYPPVYALSVRQPWAWAIVAGYKNVENRGWRPSLRHLGEVFAVHASKKVDFPAIPAVEQLTHTRIPTELQTGAIIGTVRLVGVESGYEPTCGNPWRNEQRYGLLLQEPTRIDPIPCKGALNFWRLPQHIRTQLGAQLRKDT